MDSLISVIIPVYNREHCLARCLDSIRRQIFANWECIIIDGVSAARNRGLEMNLISGIDHMERLVIL